VKPAPFSYHRVADSGEAVALVSELGEDAKFLAGGQSLIPLLALRLTRFDHLIDLNRATDLGGIRVVDSEVRMGAMVRQSEVIQDSTLAHALGLLPAASRQVGHFQIRNRGTVGGSIAHADPAAEYPAVALALGATLELRSVTGLRSVAAEEFFVSTFVTAMQPDELLTEVRFPVWGARSGFGLAEGARRAGDFAIAGAAVGVQLRSDGRLGQAAIALFGVGSTPVRATTAEANVIGCDPRDLTGPALAEIGKAATDEIDPAADLHASAAYRRHLAAVMVGRALTDAVRSASAEPEGDS
jgi:carbon-monoxide dehydrogenase medium subunit